MEVFLSRNMQEHGLRTPNEAFFHSNPELWAWADKFWGIIGVFLAKLHMIYHQPFWYSEFLIHVFHYSAIIFTKK